MFSAVAGLEIIGLAKSRLSPSGQIDGPASLCNGNQDANRKCKTEIKFYSWATQVREIEGGIGLWTS